MAAAAIFTDIGPGYAWMYVQFPKGSVGPDQRVQDASVQPITYGNAAADYRPGHVGAVLKFSQCGTLTVKASLHV